MKVDPDNETLMLTQDQFVMLEALKEARAQKKEWQEQEDRCRHAILEAVGDATLLYYEGRFVADIQNRETSKFNRKLFKEDFPRFDQEYTLPPTLSKVITIIDDTPEE